METKIVPGCKAIILPGKTIVKGGPPRGTTVGMEVTVIRFIGTPKGSTLIHNAWEIDRDIPGVAYDKRTNTYIERITINWVSEPRLMRIDGYKEEEKQEAKRRELARN